MDKLIEKLDYLRIWLGWHIDFKHDGCFPPPFEVNIETGKTRLLTFEESFQLHLENKDEIKEMFDNHYKKYPELKN